MTNAGPRIHAPPTANPPAPLPARLSRSPRALLLFGGSFDPPHLAHVAQARAALRAMPAGSWLLLVPAARSPLKRRAPGAPDRDRLAMLRAAFRPITRSALWTDELDRARHHPAPSYWVDTLERLISLLPTPNPPPVRFLIGADQAAAFHRWRRARDILSLAEPLVVLRPPLRTARALRRAMERAAFWTAPELDSWQRRVVRTRLSPISATAVRSDLAQSPRAPVAQLPPRVADYIAAHNLYR